MMILLEAAMHSYSVFLGVIDRWFFYPKNHELAKEYHRIII
jgi:hypothetical protein